MERVGNRNENPNLFRERSAVVEIPAVGYEADATCNTAAYDRPVRIVAFGDSLTAGFPALESYAQFLSEELFLKAGVAIEMTICGLCGLTSTELCATATLEGRVMDAVGRSGYGIQQIIQKQKDRWQTADLVLIMAGTNDLNTLGTSTETITDNIKQLHAICHKEGVRTICLGIPDAGKVKYDPRKQVSAAVPKNNKLLTQKQETYLRQRHIDAENAKLAKRRAVNGALARWVRGECTASASAAASSGDACGVPSLESYMSAFEKEDVGQATDVTSLDALLATLDHADADDARSKGCLDRPELFINVASLLPYGPRTRAAGCWERDALHFSREGSRRIGTRLAGFLQAAVGRARAAKVLGQGPSAASLTDGVGADTSTVLAIATTPPSLAAFLEAFRLEDDNDTKTSGPSQVQSGVAELPYSAKPWEEEAVLRLQRHFRGRQAVDDAD